MRKHILMSGVAAAVLTVAPAMAQEDPEPAPNGESSLELDLRYGNEIDARVATDVSYSKEVSLTGNVALSGDIDVDSSAVAVIDNKQILTGNSVAFREETSTDGQSGNVDPVEFGAADNLPNNPDPQDVGDTTIDIGFFSPIINTVEDFSVAGGTGNIGVNIAAGYYNMQENVASLATSTFDGSDADDTDSAGWAEASLTSLQASALNEYGPDSQMADDSGEDTAGNDYRDRNTVGNATINGTGNIGVNAAAGAFNLQKNALTVAVASDARLAEANAAVIQTADFNSSVIMDTQNVVEGPNLGSGTSGNVGVNLAAGVGNIQMNSLTIAASLASAENGGGGGGGGTGGE